LDAKVGNLSGINLTDYTLFISLMYDYKYYISIKIEYKICA